MKKYKFLQAIIDPAYESLKTNLQVDFTKRYEDCIDNLRKITLLQGDSTMQRQYKSSRIVATGANDRRLEQVAPAIARVPNELWKTFTPEQQAIWRKARQFANRN